MNQALDLITSLGIAGWIAFAISLIGIGATIEDAWRNWADKRDDPHWRRLTTTRVLTLTSGAVLSALLAGLAGTRSESMQRELASTGQVAQSAQVGVSDARTNIAKLRNTMTALTRESQDALNAASAENVRAKEISAKIVQLNSDTHQRLVATDLLARRAATIAASSQQIAQRAVEAASKNKVLAQQAAANALASQRAAVAAAVKAHVYRLSDTTIARIDAALVGTPAIMSTFIACAPGLEEVCGQLASAFRAVGMDPTVRPGVPFWSAGLDADPLARTTNPNISVAYMTSYEKAARAIESALAQAGLRTELVPFPPNTVKPNLEINFLYVGAAP